jgi:5-formyltetrahydrofolate cyclo-ligase
MLAQRKLLSTSNLDARSRLLTEVVATHPSWRDARGVAAFVGVRGEPDTRPLLQRILDADKRLWLPRVSSNRERLEFHLVRALDELIPGPMGLWEPPPGPHVSLHEATELELMLIPGLAFNRAGARLGFGKGYYDRALAPLRARSSPVRIALCFKTALDPGAGPIPIDDHDVPMHWIATPERLTRCVATDDNVVASES